MPIGNPIRAQQAGPESILSPVKSNAKRAEHADLVSRLHAKAKFLRYEGLKLNSRTLHAGAALSSADIIACLFYHVLRLDPKNPAWTDRDIFINSRGHACEPVYVAMADLGFFPWDDLQHVEDFGSHLHGLTATTTRGIEFSTGALGTGLSLAVGAALAQRVQKRPGRVVIVTGDGELQEGLFWEAAMSANHYRLDNLTVIVDRNGYQSNDRGTETVMRLEPLEQRFAAFGFETRRLDGHDPDALLTALESLPLAKGKPSVVIADTVKGKGVSFLESGHIHCGRFGRDFEMSLLEQALQELEGQPV
jgi:transketolase